MDVKYKITICCVALVAAFAFGRFEAPTKVVTKTVEVEKIVEHKNIETHTTVTKKPDGTVTVIIDKKDKTTASDQRRDESTKIVERDAPAWKVGVMAGTLVTGNFKPIYGASIEHRFVGPIYLGVFGLNNGTAGLTVSLSF